LYELLFALHEDYTGSAGYVRWFVATGWMVT
jgi:hypothetical protein